MLVIRNSTAGLLLGLSAVLAIFSVTPGERAFADTKGVEAGFRLETNIGPGQPANDMPGFSLTGRYQLNEKWWLGGAIEHSPLFDVETPYTRLGITADELDAEATSTMLSLWAERRYLAGSGRRYLFWTAGFGINSVDVDDLPGTATDSTPFVITTDVGTETVLTLTGGQRHLLGDSWSIGYGARIEQRFADWELRDTVSGESDTISDYFVNGLFADINFRF